MGRRTTAPDCNSLWTHTMNRCFSGPIRAATPAQLPAQPVKLTRQWGQLTACLCVACITTATAWAQTGHDSIGSASAAARLDTPLQRSFPPKALRADMTVVNSHEVLLNDRLVRLSPGSRIRSTSNALVVSGALVGQRFVVNYTTDTQGQAHDIWILTAAEAADRRIGSSAQQNVRPISGEQ